MALIDNLISYWKLDESSGNAIDAHDNNDGTITGDGVTQGATGKINTAYTFAGSDDYLSIGDKANLDFGTGNFSISAWIKTSSNSIQVIFGKQGTGSGWYFYYQYGAGFDSMILYHRASGTFAEGTTALVDGNWHYVVATREGAVGKIYVDGIDDTLSSGDLSANVNSAGDNAVIGIRIIGGTFDREFLGTIDEVAIWNKALTSSEVTELWNGGAGLAYPFSVVTRRDIHIE